MGMNAVVCSHVSIVASIKNGCYFLTKRGDNVTTQEKLNLLQEIVCDEPEMDSILDKIVLLQREA